MPGVAARLWEQKLGAFFKLKNSWKLLKNFLKSLLSFLPHFSSFHMGLHKHSKFELQNLKPKMHGEQKFENLKPKLL